MRQDVVRAMSPRRCRFLWLAFALVPAALLRPREGRSDNSEAFVNVAATQLDGSLLKVTSQLHTASLGLATPVHGQSQRLLRMLRRAEEGAPSDVSSIDFRVGKIVSAKNHPDSDKLLVEQIDVGEEEPRQIVSGIAKYFKPEEIEGRKVVIVANLKERKIGGIASNGMLLCASLAGEKEDEKAALSVVEAPEGAAVGERVKVEVEGEAWGEAATPNQVQKKKLYEKVAPHLRTNADGVVCFKETSFQTSAGPITAPSLPNAVVS